jgi:chromosome segregation ATPase
VTLDGTIIHKSGLITGGRSTHDSAKKWEEKDIQGTFILRRLYRMKLDADVCLVCLRRVVANKG